MISITVSVFPRSYCTANMVSIKLFLCLFSAVVLQNVAVDANEKFIDYVIQELKKDAEIVKEKLENTKYSLNNHVNATTHNYHTYVEKVIENAELKLRSMVCKEGTMDRVKGVKTYGWGSFQDCVNLTRSIADGELVIYDTVLYLEGVAKLIVNITKSIAECRRSSLFKAASCVVETFANHSTDYKEKSDAILSLFSRMDNLTQQVHEDFNSCIGTVHYSVSEYVDNVILENCKKPSFFKRLFNKISSNLNKQSKSKIHSFTDTQKVAGENQNNEINKKSK